MMTDSTPIDWRTPIKSKIIFDYNSFHQKMFTDISKNSKYAFWMGTVSSIKVNQTTDYHSTLKTAIERTLGTYAASYAGEKIVKKAAPKILTKLGLEAGTKCIIAGIAIGAAAYDLIQTVKNYNEIPFGNYNQYVVTVEGYCEDDYIGRGKCVTYYVHTFTVVEKTVGNSTEFVIVAEDFFYTEN